MGRPKKKHPGQPKGHRGRERVWWLGRWWDLGPAGSAAARAEYQRLSDLWVADPTASPLPKGERLVAELCADYLASADCPTGDRQRARVVTAVDLLTAQHGPRPVGAFGPVDLRAWQHHLCALPDPKDPARTRFNVTSVRDLVSAVRRVWAWGVSTGRLRVELYQALLTVRRPKPGEARKAKRVRPANPEHVKATLPRLRGPVRAMVQLEIHTGARPDELCRMTAGDVRRAGVFEPEDGEAINLDAERVWVYAPAEHKMAWKDKGRVLVFAGNARDILAPFLDRPAAAYCFSPRDTLAELRAEQRVAREKREGGSGGNRKPPAAAPACVPSDHYTPRTYRQAIERACRRAGVPHWYPYQLRHLAGADIKALFGIDAVAATLGHHTRSMAEHYGGRSLRTAAEVARKRGEDKGPAADGNRD